MGVNIIEYQNIEEHLENIFENGRITVNREF